MDATVKCPICFGKGKWLGYSDAEWKAGGLTKPPTSPMSCGHCRGTGRAKDYRLAALSKQDDAP